MSSSIGMDERMNDTWTLPNGLRVIGERLPYLRSVSIGVWLKVGSMMEKPRENGLSHFLEHMVFKGTEKRTTRQIAEEMDAVGGQINAFTGKDCTCFYCKVIDEDLPLAVDILADLTCHASLDEGEFNKERGVILEEIAMDEDSPEDLVHELLSRAMFGEQSLGQPILGTTELISGYTRQDLFNYRARHYGPANTVVALAGNYDPAQVEALIAEHFGPWTSDAAPADIPATALLSGQRVIKEKDTEQQHLCLGFPGIGYGQDGIYPQAVLNNVLGGSMSSRLFQRIREEMGMAYSIYTFPNSYLSCGTFAVYAGVSPKNGEKVMAEIRTELERLLRDGITEKEYHDAKQQLRGGYLLGLESPGGRMQAMGRSLLLLDKAVTPEETVRHIEAVTLDSVMTIARESLTAVPNIAVAGKGAENFRY